MNICFINPTKKLRYGIKGLSKYLISRGHKVIVLTPRMLKEDELNGLSSVSFKIYPSIFLPGIRYTIPFFLRQYGILRETLRREKIDIIHLWTYYYPAVWVPLIFARVFRIPVILSTGSFPGISWKYDSKFIDLLAKVYSKSIGKIILRRCDKVFLYNPRIATTAQEMGIQQNNLVVCPSGIMDSARFHQSKSNVADIRKSLGIYEDEAMILNVGRLVPVKGIITAIAITEELIKDGFKLKTVIVGDGPFRKKYEKIVQKRGIQEQVIFTGFRKDIVELMSACDVFLFPSVGEELGGALLEAAECSKPLVASNVGGIPLVIIHGETGFLAEPTDIESFVYHVKLLLTHKDLAKELGRKARKHVTLNFNWDEFAKKNEDIYQQVMNTE
jgi:glycosyltransferase involved in cell wall biosynthesis